MPNAKRHSWHRPTVGRLLFTVELEPVADRHSGYHQLGLANLVRQLVELSDACGLAITWAVGDPAQSAATSLVMRSAVAHEMAVLGDPNWLGPTAGRTRFARELARRVSHARAIGLNLTALVPRVADVDRDIDLIVKQGLHAVAGIGTGAGRRALPLPTALHYDVWQIPVTRRLPMPARWFSSSERTVSRGIRRAARDGATYHLVIDAPAVEREGPHSIQTVETLIRAAALLRDRGLIQNETLGTAAARLSDVPAASPQRSILRQAG